MKKTAFTTLLAGALLSVGCSDSTEKTAAATPTPVPELTFEQKAAIPNSVEAAQAAERRQRMRSAKTDVDAVVPADATALPVEPLDPSASAAAPSPTPTP